VNKTKEKIEQVSEQVADTMLEMHRASGPGLLESTNQACLACSGPWRGLAFFAVNLSPLALSPPIRLRS
jgi:hypothetical protein